MEFSPALCTWYEPFRLAFPCFAQPKLNGLRAIYKDGHFFSRSGHQWADPLLRHMLTPLRRKSRPELILDGEFYRHGWTLDRIAEAVSLFRKEPTADTMEVGFYVFDTVADEPFADRRSCYVATLTKVDCQYVQPVPAIRVDSHQTADAFHQLNLRTGFEGTIYRTGQGGYRPDRDRCLMKRKERRGSGFTADRDFKPRTDRWATHQKSTINPQPPESVQSGLLRFV